MKSTTAQAKAMTRGELIATRVKLGHSIPSDQSLLDAVKRELRRRERTENRLAKQLIDLGDAQE